MASHKELLVEWTMLDGDCNNWTLQDLQLAAELGRTLLERNEELENELKQQQAIIEDQAQEIEFLTKQATSMKEQSETRGKFYEQLEQTIIELERTNTHLSREHEIDKKRIQSLCENIEYLERKCEEMSRALETIRDEQAKRGFHGSRGKMNRGSYFNFGSDSSEEDNMNSGFGFGYGYGFRRRSHSLQDLRDYTPSPDEFDSGNSNSPDLKTSESEYVESLESRIEELLVAKKSEVDKVHQLESQIRLLIQENANLQNQLVQMSNEKDEQIADLRRQLLDSGNYSQLSFNTSAITATSTRRNSAIGGGATSSHDITTTLGILAPASPSCSSSTSNSPRISSSSNHGDVEASSSSSSSSTSSSSRDKSHLGAGVLNLLNVNNNHNGLLMCKRCSTEVSILSLVNSIEVENDETNGCFADFPYGVTGISEDHDMEFSSLEHELARATGASLPLDNRHKKSPPRSVNRSFPLFPRHRTSIFQRDKSANKLSNGANDIQLECDEELEYDENFELFLGHEPTFGRGESTSGAKQGRRLFTMEESSDAGGSSTHDDMDLDEEPCLTKDRKPEISRSKKNSGRSFSKSCSNSKTKKTPGSSRNSSSCSRVDEEGSGSLTTELVMEPSEEQPLQGFSVSFSSKFHSKLLELPTRIPSDEEDDEFEYDEDIVDGIHAAKSCVPVSASDTAILNDQLQEVLREGELICENNNDTDKCHKTAPVKKTKCGIQESSSSSGYDSEEGSSTSASATEEENVVADDAKKNENFPTIEFASTQPTEPMNGKNLEPSESVDFAHVAVTSEGHQKTDDDTGKEENLDFENSDSSTSTVLISSNNNNSSSSIVPEYKQIFQNLFSLFNNSKRKYPIPMYPIYVKGQSSALKMSQSINTTTNKNSNNGCSSH